jgi:hypothetical protein
LLSTTKKTGYFSLGKTKDRNGTMKSMMLPIYPFRKVLSQMFYSLNEKIRFSVEKTKVTKSNAIYKLTHYQTDKICFTYENKEIKTLITNI